LAPLLHPPFNMASRALFRHAVIVLAATAKVAHSTTLRASAAPEAAAPYQPALRALAPLGMPADTGSQPPMSVGEQFAVPDVAQTVGQRIEQDGHKIGLVAENLVAVQGDINRVEKEVLGKVFDLQSMKNFFNTHQAAVEESKQLNGDISKLSGEVSFLSGQLGKARLESDQSQKDHRMEASQMQGKITEDEAVIQGLGQELKREKAIEADNAKLQEVNAILRGQNSKTTDAAAVVHEELTVAKAVLQKAENTADTFKEELVAQHQYGEACHQRVSALQNELHEVTQKHVEERNYDTQTIHQATVDSQHSQQMLAAQNEDLKARLAKAQQNRATFQTQLGATHQQMHALQGEASTELNKMRDEVAKMRAHAAAVQGAVAAGAQNRQVTQAHIAQTQLQVDSMQQTLLTNKLQLLQTKNAQLKEDMARLQEALKQSQLGEAKAEAVSMQAKEAEASWKSAAAQNAAAAQNTAREALVEIAKAKKGDEDAATQASEATMDAEASLLTKCDSLWDKKHPKVFAQLEKCKQTKQDLRTVSAQVASLSSTIKGAQ